MFSHNQRAVFLLDVIARRILGDRGDALEQQIGAFLASARVPARYRLPAVYPRRIFTEVGGLLSYGIDQLDNFRLAATYADRILKGEKPADTPVEQPTKFELVINHQTARMLGLEIPAGVLAI